MKFLVFFLLFLTKFCYFHLLASDTLNEEKDYDILDLTLSPKTSLSPMAVSPTLDNPNINCKILTQDLDGILNSLNSDHYSMEEKKKPNKNSLEMTTYSDIKKSSEQITLKSPLNLLGKDDPEDSDHD